MKSNTTYLPQEAPYEFPLYKTVLDTPKEDAKHFHEHISSRYNQQLLYTMPKAFIRAYRTKNFNKVTDEEICSYYSQTSFCHWLKNLSAAQFEEWATHFDLNTPEDLVIINYQAMGNLETFKNYHSAACQALFQKVGKNQLRIIGIKLNDEFFTPEDGMQWGLCKCYILLGAFYHLTLLNHPRVHFQMDAIIGHTFRLLPQGHFIRQLLEQHFEFTLDLNNAVLHSPRSVINNLQRYPYGGLSGKKEGALFMISTGYTGHEKWEGYEPYSFNLEPEFMHMDYYEYRLAYYNYIHDFVAKAIELKGYKTDKALQQWAIAIAEDLPGFKASYVFSDLSKLIAKIIFNASVEHAADHGSYAQIPPEKMFLRIQQAPPSKKKPHKKFNYKDIRSRFDLFKHLMVWFMFFKPTNVTLLKDVDYQFKDPNLKALNKSFREGLYAVENQLKAKGIHIYETVDQLSCSIQY